MLDLKYDPEFSFPTIETREQSQINMEFEYRLNVSVAGINGVHLRVLKIENSLEQIRLLLESYLEKRSGK